MTGAALGSLIVLGRGANATIGAAEGALLLLSAGLRAPGFRRRDRCDRAGDGAGNAVLQTNTDIEGFLNNLDASAPGWDAATDALVLGAGGASRAVIFGLIERSIARVHLANRTMERAQALADQFGPSVVPVPWEAIGHVLPRAGLLVNTTSLGMKGQPPLAIDVGLLPPHAVVADLVYLPLQTPLLAAAQARGLRTADGLGMLLHQAVRGFELWFGQRPEVTPELRALVEDDLAKT